MPHIVITNRTGVPVSLRQAGGHAPRPSFAAHKSAMLTAKSHGELLTASPVPQITDNAAQQLLPSGASGLPLNLIGLKFNS